MTYLPPTVLAASTVVENAIAVNSAGARFHDEAGTFDDRIASLRAQTQVRADSLTELAAALRIPAGALEATAAGVNISCGGFRTTARMQVIDVPGRPVAVDGAVVARTGSLHRRSSPGARALPRLLSNSCCR